MKSLNKLFAITVLSIVLAHAALGSDGIIHTDAKPTPTPTPPSATADGGDEMCSDGTTNIPAATTDTTDISTEVALSLLDLMFTIY